MVLLAFPSVDEVLACENVERLLEWNRFLPPPETPTQAISISAVVKRLSEVRARDNDAYVAASKNLGWRR